MERNKPPAQTLPKETAGSKGGGKGGGKGSGKASAGKGGGKASTGNGRKSKKATAATPASLIKGAVGLKKRFNEAATSYNMMKRRVDTEAD
eukprot:5187233-Pyramimonas_sp.AAC.1